MSKKQLLCKLVSNLGLTRFAKVINKIKPGFKVLAYHRVMDVDWDEYPYDADLISASCEQFERQVAYLVKNYNVVTLKEAWEKRDVKGKENVVITFDDGFDDLYHNIFPILKKYNVSATMFISTGYMDSGEYLWTDKLTFHLNSNLDKKIDFFPYLENEPVMDAAGTCSTILGKMLRIMKQIPDSERVSFLENIFEILPVDSATDTTNKMLSWDMVKEMSDYGIEFGSHTVTHPILTRLTGEKLFFELNESKKMLEKNTGVECVSIAYPVGGVTSYDSRVIGVAQKVGYTVACCYVPGVSPLPITDEFCLKRLHVEHYTSFDQFKAQLVLPKWCGYSPSPH